MWAWLRAKSAGAWMQMILWRSLRDSNPCYSLERRVILSMAVHGHVRKWLFYRPFLHYCPPGSGIIFPYRSVRRLQPWPSYHASATANGSHFGESLTGSVWRREPRWAFDEALIHGSRGFAVVMGSISTNLSANRWNLMRPRAKQRPGSRSSPAPRYAA